MAAPTDVVSKAYLEALTMPAADEGKHGASEKPSDETEGAKENPSDETISSEAPAAEKNTNECTEELAGCQVQPGGVGA